MIFGSNLWRRKLHWLASLAIKRIPAEFQKLIMRGGDHGDDRNGDLLAGGFLDAWSCVNGLSVAAQTRGRI